MLDVSHCTHCLTSPKAFPQQSVCDAARIILRESCLQQRQPRGSKTSSDSIRASATLSTLSSKAIADAKVTAALLEAPATCFKKPQVLAPAGGWPQLKAAVENGADAVYLGLSVFNARARAVNFSPEEVPEVPLSILAWLFGKSLAAVYHTCAAGRTAVLKLDLCPVCTYDALIDNNAS